MLSVRMQRLGRKGHPVYRVVVQDKRQAPTSGKYVALLGSYDPHTKTVNLDKEKAEFYLSNGAQPSERVVKLFAAEKVKLPDWVEKPVEQKREIRNPDKLRRNRPADAPVPEKPADDTPSEEVVAENVEEPKVPEAESSEKPAEGQAEPTNTEAGQPAEESVEPAEEAASEAEDDKTADSAEKTA